MLLLYFFQGACLVCKQKLAKFFAKGKKFLRCTELYRDFLNNLDYSGFPLFQIEALENHLTN